MFSLSLLGGFTILLIAFLLGIAASSPTWLLGRVKAALIVAGIILAIDGYLVLAARGLYQ
jgi:hypothetical protein